MEYPEWASRYRILLAMGLGIRTDEADEAFSLRNSPVNLTACAQAVAGYYAVATLVTFALYAWDKRAARCAGARVRERTLHVWAWLGGFCGALAGQWWLRHKSLRVGFALNAWLALLTHAAGWIWWLVR